VKVRGEIRLIGEFEPPHADLPPGVDMVDAEAPANGLGKKNELVVLEPAAGTMLVTVALARGCRTAAMIAFAV